MKLEIKEGLNSSSEIVVRDIKDIANSSEGGGGLWYEVYSTQFNKHNGLGRSVYNKQFSKDYGLAHNVYIYPTLKQGEWFWDTLYM